MTAANQFLLALVTAPDVRTARRLARLALDGRLAACANLVPGLESHYRWRGKLERSSEILILFKTSVRRRDSLEKLILEQHPYDTPEFITLRLDKANARYLEWWAKCCR